MAPDSKTIKLKDEEFPFFYRASSLGDKGVIDQIFNKKDYDISRWKQSQALTAYYDSYSKQPLIIDAGANIGASSVYFMMEYPKARVFSIEPDPDNFDLLERNTRTYPGITRFSGAIADRDGTLSLVDPDRSDWGFMTQAEPGDPGCVKATVPAISVPTILARPDLQDVTPFILKVDIEGGEESLFRGDVAWMDQFALIILELHDWMLPFSGSSRPFLRAVVDRDFDFVHRGENIFLFNRTLLGSLMPAANK